MNGLHLAKCWLFPKAKKILVGQAVLVVLPDRLALRKDLGLECLHFYIEMRPQVMVHVLSDDAEVILLFDAFVNLPF